jgi:hypothetical protein
MKAFIFIRIEHGISSSPYGMSELLIQLVSLPAVLNPCPEAIHQS